MRLGAGDNRAGGGNLKNLEQLTDTENLAHLYRPPVNKSYADWYIQHHTNGDDFGFGENVWQAAQKATWAEVFQIVSDNPQMATRELIRTLEAARESAGYGPKTGDQ